MNNKIENLYQDFFKDFDIDNVTGKLVNYPNIKFVTMPYIGSKYFTSKKKILFVGTDVGKDETPGSYQNLEERNKNIEYDSGFNPHIAGTYCSSLFLLKDCYNWQDLWDNFKNYSTNSNATKIKNHIDGENPLSFIALTNLHKFVTINREKRSGGENRKFLKRQIEEDLLIKEIEILNPDLIFFQGKLPSETTLFKIKDKKIQIILAPHPSNRKRGGRNPKNYVEAFVSMD